MDPSNDGARRFHNVNVVLHQVGKLRPANEPPIRLDEMLDICDTEGNLQNGGGSFVISDNEGVGISVRFEPDSNSSLAGGVAIGAGGGHRSSIGEIGSPVSGGAGAGLQFAALRQFPSAMGF